MNQQSYIARSRVGDDPRWRRWIVGLALAYFVAQIAFTLVYQVSNNDDAAIFGSFWEAGRHLDYQLHPLVWVSELDLPELNMNPPIALPLFQLFAQFDPQVGQSIWLVLSAGVYLASVWAMRGATTIQLVWLLTFPIVFASLGIGQIYVLLFALGVVIHGQISRGNTIAAAALVGLLVALKPNFALWGLAAFAAGYRREAVIAGAVATGLTAVPVLLYGSPIYAQWLAAVAADTHYLYPHDVSIGGIFRRFGIPGRELAILLGIVATTGWAWRVRPTLYDLTPVAWVAAVLCSPLAWQDYSLVTLAFLVDRPWRLPLLFATFLMFAFPLVWEAATKQGHILFASLVCVTPVLLMLAVFERRARLAKMTSPSDIRSRSADTRRSIAG